MVTTLVGQDRLVEESTKLTLAVESIPLGVDLTAQDVIAHSPRKCQPYDGLEMKPATVVEHPDRDRLHRESCRYFLYHLFHGHRNRDWKSHAVFDDDEQEPMIRKRSFPKSAAGMKASSVKKLQDKTIVIINEEEVVDMIG